MSFDKLTVAPAAAAAATAATAGDAAAVANERIAHERLLRHAEAARQTNAEAVD